MSTVVPPTVEDFEALANPNGLVPMRFLQGTITEHVGDIRGAAPSLALRWYNIGLAEPMNGISLRAAEPRPAEDERPEIEIPATWREEHLLSRIALAKRISGSREKISGPKADAIIEAYLAGETGNITEPTPTPVASGDLGPHAVTSQTVIPHV